MAELTKTDGGSVPVPDPTTLTTAALRAAIEGQEKRFEIEIGAMKEAVRLLQANADKSPTIAVVDENLKGFKALAEQKFIGVDKQFEERDKRIEQSTIASKVAVDAALQAAEKAVKAQNDANVVAADKSERAFTKQIDLLLVQQQQNTKAADDKIDDLKARLATIELRSSERVTAIESHTKGIGDSWGILIGAIAALGVIVTLVVLLLKAN